MSGENHPRVLVMVGGGREHSHTLVLADMIAHELTGRGATAEVWNAVDFPPPSPSVRSSATDHPDAHVRDVAERCARSDAFVWVTPVFHNSYSSHLKSVLDHLDSTHFAWKVVGLASHGNVRTPQAVDHLRIVARSLHAITTPSQVCTSAADYELRDGARTLVDPEISRRVERLATDLVGLSRALSLAASNAAHP